jgi:hypothetical protein
LKNSRWFVLLLTEYPRIIAVADFVMKKNCFVATKFFAGLALAVGITLSAVAQTERPAPSTVLRVAGKARCSVDNGVTWKLLKAGDVIYARALIQTAEGSDLDLLIGEQMKAPAKGTTFNPESRPCHFVSLAADTVLHLEKITRDAASTEEILLELRTGTINGNVKTMVPGSKYEVGFASGIAGMRESIYRLSSGGQLNVMKGKAYVAMNDSSEVKVVEAGGAMAGKVPATTSTTVAPAAVAAPQPVATATQAQPIQPAPSVTTPTKDSPAARVPPRRSSVRRVP